MKFKFLIYLLLPLLFSAVYAQDYSSSITIYPKEITVSQCGIATYDLSVKNTGIKEDTLYALVEGIPEGWYSLSHESIKLKPGESKNVYLFVTANCFEEPKNYTAKISFLGNSESYAEFKMNVVSDHSISILVPSEIRSCACEETPIKFVLANTGKYEEKVKLTVKGGYVKQDVINLKPGEQSQFEMVLEKSCNSYGNYTFEINAESMTSYAKTSKKITINRENCHDFQIKYDEVKNLCLNEKATFSVSIYNTGTLDDEYLLYIDALDISEKVNISSKSNKTFNLVFESDEVGVIDLGFSVKSSTKESKGMIRFNIEKCYGVDLQAEQNEITILLGDGRLVKAKLTNTGSKNDTFRIISDVKWVSLRPEQIRVEGMKSEDIFIYYSPEYNQLGVFNTTIKAFSENSKDEESIKVNVVSELPIIQPEENASTTTTLQQSEGVSNKTLIALGVGILITIFIFGMIYLFVMRD
ncbi:MAG: hypothetical protein N3D75_01030 [Candidatus Aenigmarchaeota archaeon]|nr:hypothetical protein [Candidatus Aenigmarchaeota archaeon]